jgi:cytochrome c biogenesis protein CcmG, thiol:disulfide interchange protein DsbE
VSEVVRGPEQPKLRRGLWVFLVIPWVLVLGACLVWPLIARYYELGPEHAMVGQPAPEFSAPLVAGDGAREGDRIRLADLRGKPVVLDFWASWCGPCRRSIPSLNDIHLRQRSSGVHIIGVNVDSGMPARQISALARSFGATFPSVTDETGSIQRAYQVQSLPTTVVIDAQGVVRHLHVGVPDEEGLEREIRSLLQ